MMVGVEVEGAVTRSLVAGLRTIEVGGSGVGSLEFAEAARLLGPVIRQHDCEVPTFRSPPRKEGQTRSLRRRPNGSVTIAIALRGRSLLAVVADMIDGVVVANRVGSATASLLREDLWDVVAPLLGVGVGVSTGNRAASSPSRSGHLAAPVTQLRPYSHMSEAA